MDPKSSIPPEIQKLIDHGENVRGHLTDQICTLRHKIDVPARLRGSVGDRPKTWLLGSLASGLVLSLILFRKGKSRQVIVEKKPSGGIGKALLSLAWTASKPLAQNWIENKVGNLAASQRLKR